MQELTATGAFIAMFGWGVNHTNDRQATASQAEKNLCTAASGDRCTAGTTGTAAAQLADPSGVAVEPATGDVYVLEVTVGDYRVDKYTADGRFVWTIGKHVNATTGGNLCTEREIEQSNVDPLGRLAVIGNENVPHSLTRLGSLYDGSGRHIAYYTGPSDNDGIAFNREGDLYVVATDDQEVVVYVPVPVVELVTSPLACDVGGTTGSSEVFNCALSAS